MDLDSGMMLRIVTEATQTVRDELTQVQLPVEGEIPRGIDGVLFRNGPGRFERGGARYGHPFDGDGHVVRIDLGPQSARLTNRFVRTGEYLQEERSGRMRYRAFGTNLPGGLRANLLRMRIKNAANTNLIWQGGRLLALWEGGPPHRLDPHTLATLGPESFDGRLRNQGPGPLGWLARRLSPLLPFSAHPRLDAETGELLNFGLVFGPSNQLMVYRVDRGGHMAVPEAYPLPRFSFVHDLAVTHRWLCVLLPRADYDVPRALLGLKTPIGSLRLATEHPMQALLIPRGSERGEPPKLFDCVPGFVFHIAQAFDREDGRLVLDAVRYRQFPAFDDFESLYREPHPGMVPRLERVTLHPEAGHCAIEPWGGQVFELPTTAPGGFGRPRRFIYGIGAPPERLVPYLTTIQRLDTETGEMRSRDFGLDLPGEPVLVPGDDGSEGWLLSLVHRAGQGRTDLVILRASDLALRATATLPCVVPVGFHGCWVPRRGLPSPGGSG